MTHATRGNQLPPNWRVRLPNPAAYYAQHVPGLGQPDTLGTARGRCPMHENNNPLIDIDAHGGWRCHGKCGSGDLVDFAMRLRLFNEAVLDLIGED